MKRMKLVPALFLFSVMFLSACQGKSAVTSPDETQIIATSPDEAQSTSPGTEPEEEIVSEPYITYMTQDYGTLNYFNSNKSVDSEEGFSHFVDALIQHDKFGGLAPDIATDWSVSADGLTWTVKIRKDVMWVRDDGSDYALLTAHDYVAGAKYILDPSAASVTVDFMLDFIQGAKEYYEDNQIGFDSVGVKAVDDYTLEYTMIAPTPFFPSLLTYTTYLPVSQAFLDEIGPSNFGLAKDKILYNGSYILDKWEKDVERLLVKNDKYFDAGRIHVPYIKYFSVSDGTVAVELYKRGEITAAGIATAQLEEIMNDGEYKDHLYVTNPSSASWYFALNSQSPNKDLNKAALNKNFRAAFFYAFNKEPYLMLSNPYDISKMNSGLYSAGDISVTPEGKDYVTFGRLPELQQRNLNNFDIDKARQAMAKAKEELGDSVSWPITVRILGTAAEASERQNAIIKQLFEEAFPGDIIIETKIYTSDTYYQIMDEGDYEFTNSGWSADYADPSAYLGTLIPGHDVDRFGFGNYPEMQEYVRLYNEAMAITNDINARYEKFAEAETVVYDNFIIIPFRYNGGNYAINKIQNPYDALRGGFGLSSAKMHDRIYGTTPLTAAEREEQRVAYEQEKAAH